jgi:hypothetical protein
MAREEMLTAAQVTLALAEVIGVAEVMGVAEVIARAVSGWIADDVRR